MQCMVDKEEHNSYMRKYREDNPDYEKSLNEHNKRNYKKLRDKILDLLGRECVKCPYNDSRALQIDHIQGDARLDRIRFGNIGWKMYRYYLEHTDEAKQKLQILCANCKWIKRHENKETR